MPASRAEEILSLDNVALRLPIAGVASRGLAFAIDWMILSLLSVVLFIGGFSLLVVFNKAAGWIIAAFLLFFFLLQWGYFALAEIFMQGRTPGKAALKLRVVTSDGGMPARSALTLRNLLLLIPDLFIGIFMMAADPLARRTGDRVAGTLVIRESRDSVPFRLSRVPGSWDGECLAVVEAYLERAALLEIETSYAIGERIIRWIERDDPGLLEGIARDNRHPASVLDEALQVERI